MTGFLWDHPCGYLMLQCGQIRHWQWKWRYVKRHGHCWEIGNCIYIAWHWQWPPGAPVC